MEDFSSCSGWMLVRQNCGEEQEEGREKSVGELQVGTNIMEGEMKWERMTCNHGNAISPLLSPLYYTTVSISQYCSVLPHALTSSSWTTTTMARDILSCEKTMPSHYTEKAVWMTPCEMKMIDCKTKNILASGCRNALYSQWVEKKNRRALKCTA